MQDKEGKEVSVDSQSNTRLSSLNNHFQNTISL